MRDFFNLLRPFLIPPVFEGDKEKTQSAKLLYQIISVIWGLPVLLIIIITLNPAGRGEVIAPAIVISITLFVLMIMTRIGWIGIANTIITGMAILVFAYADFQNAGNIQPSTLIIAIAIIMSGLLLGRRAPLVTAVLIVISHSVIVYLQLQGAIEAVSSPALGFENMIITGIMILMIAFLFRFVISRLQFALDQSRKDEKELQISNRELEEIRISLEQSIADRTKELEAAQEVMAKRAAELQSVAEIATQASQAVNVQDMLQTVVDLTKRNYNLYHAHIYLLDNNRTQLVLTAGAGAVGQQMVDQKRIIPLKHANSLVARAARVGDGTIANDVTKEPDFLPNPLLPETKAEMAIPISIGNIALGVLDVQADHINRFTNEDIAIMTTLAQQVATSLQNIRSFAQAQSQAERESLLNQIGQQIQNADSVEAVLQITARALGQALHSKDTRVVIRDAELPGTGQIYS
jgi:putative methionine-R-sulfoxide reductase with GAF domain